MAFDPANDSIAITVPYFELRKSSEGGLLGHRHYNEPYLISLAVDSDGAANSELTFNHMPFPKVRAGQRVEMLGDGHLVYGPKNPGEFVAISVLVMESDSDLMQRGGVLEDLVRSKAAELGVGIALRANPIAGGVLGVLKELTQFVAGVLKTNSDDELYRTEGTFLRDGAVPYHVNRRYGWANDFVDLAVQIIPLSSSNGQGSEPKRILLIE